MIQRDEALTLLKEYLKNDNLVKHSLAVEAIMTALAKHLSENSEVWGLTGLLHDIDYEYTKDDPTKHRGSSQKVVLTQSSPIITSIRSIFRPRPSIKPF
jgi:putative nucleotidyltransferase with HDIG domain